MVPSYSACEIQGWNVVLLHKTLWCKKNYNEPKVMGEVYFIKILKWALPSKGYKVEATSCRLG